MREERRSKARTTKRDRIWRTAARQALLAAFALALISGVSLAGQQRVFAVHLEEAVGRADLAFVERSIAKAGSQEAAAVIVEIDAASCSLETAVRISDLLLGKEIHTIAFINTQASGNAALIAISCSHIAISPDGSLGGPGAEERPPGQASKARAAFGVAALERGRNRELAEALAEARFGIEGLVAKGDSLKLGAEQAIEHNLADFGAKGYRDITARYDLAGTEITHLRPTRWDAALSVLLNPWLSLALLVVGIRLLVLDLLTIHTWGAAGTVGCLAIAAVFIPHALAGAGWIGFLVFFVAVWLMLLESYVLPGIGVAFVFGTIASFAGIYMGLTGGETPSWLGVLCATAGTYVMVSGFFIHLPRSHGWQLISIRDRAEMMRKGGSTALEGKRGLAISRLNPFGSAVVDGVRVSCVTEEDVIPEGTPVCVTRVEGDTVYVERSSRGPCS